METLRKFSPWFYAAALYNLIWGSIIIIQPSLFFQLTAMPIPRYLPFWQVIGMFVLVYSPAYFWVARHPEKYPHLIMVGFLGKLLGPLGFIYAFIRGDLPLVFGIINLTNDLIWWPSFILYLSVFIREYGLKNMLLGDVTI